MNFDWLLDACRKTYPDYRIEFKRIYNVNTFFPTNKLVINDLVTKVEWIEDCYPEQEKVIVDRITDELKRFDAYYQGK